MRSYFQRWDCDLEKQAQDSLAKCSLEEKVNAGRNNIAWVLDTITGNRQGSWFQFPLGCPEVLFLTMFMQSTLWLSGQVLWNSLESPSPLMHTTEHCVSSPTWVLSEVLHLHASPWKKSDFKMVHANTTKMGCSYKKCNDQFLVSCLYDKWSVSFCSGRVSPSKLGLVNSSSIHSGFENNSEEF